MATDTPIAPLSAALAVPAGDQDVPAGNHPPAIAALDIAPAAAPTAASGTGLPGSAAATIWYFADGSNAVNDREIIALLNPGLEPASVVTTLVRADGHHVYAVTDVPPGGRASLDAGDAAGLGDLVGAIVRSTQPLFAERTVYHGDVGEEGTGAALAPGISAPASHWYLPRLRATRDDAETIAILNPGAAAVSVDVLATTRHVLRPLTRVSVPPLAVQALQVPDGATSAVVRVAAGSGRVVVEEHTVYGDGRGYSGLAGLTALERDGYLLAPTAGGGRDYLMFLNPSARAAHVALNGFNQAGKPVGSRQVLVRAGQDVIVRLTPSEMRYWQLMHMETDQPVATGYVGFLPPGSDRFLASTYVGSVAAGLTHPSLRHTFAEGDTRALLSAPREMLMLANPDRGAAHVQLVLRATGGRVFRHALTLPAGALQRVPIAGWAPPSQHGLEVLADQPILCARTIDFNEGVDRLLSYGIGGA